MNRKDAASQTLPNLPLTSQPPPSRLRVIRMVTGAVVVGPLLGAALAGGLAAARGIGALELTALAIAYVISTLGVTIGFHRYFAHRAFKTSRFMQMVFVVVGSMAMQGSLLYWVSTHRRHHQFSDTPDDPHSPHFENGRPVGRVRGLWRGHIGWMFSREMTNAVRFAPDIIRDPQIFDLQKRYGLWAMIGLAIPLVIGLATVSPIDAIAVFLWAGPVRLLLVHHASWAVGSISHISGSRPFATNDRSANNWIVAIFAFGEGLQNNHHAFPRAAHHGLKFGEPDLSGLVIDLMALCGLIWDVKRPSREMLAARRHQTTEQPTLERISHG